MYIDTAKIYGKSTRHLRRENYRHEGKVKHRTIANLSKWPIEVIEAFRLALKHKDNLTQLTSKEELISTKQGESFGAVWVIYQTAKQLGITKARGNSSEGKLALWQIIARVIDQGSRLSAVRLASIHACCVRLAKRTRGRAFVVMLAYKIIQELNRVIASNQTRKQKKAERPQTEMLNLNTSMQL